MSSHPIVLFDIVGSITSQLVCEDCQTLRPMRHQPFIDLSLSIPVHEKSNINHLDSLRKLKGGSHVRLPNNNNNNSRGFGGSNIQMPKASPGLIHLTDCLDAMLCGEILTGIECPACSATSTTAKIDIKVNKMESSTYNARILSTMMNEELESSKKILQHLRQCVMLGSVDTLVLDIDESCTLKPTFEATASIASASMFPNAVDSMTTSSTPASYQFPVSSSIFPVAEMMAPVDVIPVEAHLIERVRTSVRKSLFLTRLPKLLCFHIQRRVYNPVTCRMTKMTQHVEFEASMDMRPYFYNTATCNTTSPLKSASHTSTSSTSSTSSCTSTILMSETVETSSSSVSTPTTAAAPTTAATAGTGSLSAMSVDESLVDLQTTKPTNLSMGDMLDSRSSSSSQYLYDLCAVIIHSGSAEGGKQV